MPEVTPSPTSDPITHRRVTAAPPVADHLHRVASMWSPAAPTLTATLPTVDRTDGEQAAPSGPLTPNELAAAQSVYSRQSLPFPLYLVGSFFAQLDAAPITEYLSNTRGFSEESATRLKRTYTFCQVIVLHGPDSPQGEAVLSQVRKIHDKLKIPVDSPDFEFVLYTLSKGVCDTLRRLSAMPPSMTEELAWFKLWRRVGEKLGAQTIPTDYGEFVARNQLLQETYHRTPFPKAQQMARALVNSMTKFVPAALQPLAWLCVSASIDRKTADHLSTPKLRGLERAAVGYLMRTASYLSNRFGVWSHEQPKESSLVA